VVVICLMRMDSDLSVYEQKGHLEKLGTGGGSAGGGGGHGGGGGGGGSGERVFLLRAPQSLLVRLSAGDAMRDCLTGG